MSPTLIRLQADADLRDGIVKAARIREAAIDFASAVEVNLEGVSDPRVLDIAAQQGRILVSESWSATTGAPW